MNANKREFPTIEELSNGFSEFSLPQSDEMIGKSMVLYYEDKSRMTLEFLSDDVMKVSFSDTEETVAATYVLVSPRKGIYFLDFVKSYGDTCSVSTVIDVNKGIATTLFGSLPNREEVMISQFERADKGMGMTSVKAVFKHAAVNVEFNESTQVHEQTKELVGKRIQFKYSTNDMYEHIYLNENYYVWHCIKGIEKGLCDTDRCHYYKITDNLYWFTWLEKVIPTIGTVMEDLSETVMRSYGKIFGYETYEMTKVTNFPVGSYAKEMNVTEYEE